ncbi:MAG: hypothetical protein SNH13_01200 [Rikenellaceae bacterium]
MNNKFLVASISALMAVSAVMAQGKYPTSSPIKSIPTPPTGQRWVLSEIHSDEFNGTELDKDKWFDYHPTWKGRAPGLFIPENVSVEDGCLVLRSSKLPKEVVIKSKWNPTAPPAVYTIGGAAVITKDEKAHYGYYEARVKANKTSMSTTFWLSRGGNNHDAKVYQPKWFEPGKFGQELDICETIGRTGTAAEGWKPMAGRFCQTMNSNIHCWYRSDATKKQEDVAIKHMAGLKPQSGKMLSEDFNVYGCWWKNENTAEFYLNDITGGENKFIDRQGRPFNLPMPMGINLVVETYSWIPTPTDEDLNDPAKNQTYYDWVRHYVLVDVNKSGATTKGTEIFKDKVNISKEAPVQVKAGKKAKVKLNVLYTSNEHRDLNIKIFNKGGKVVGEKTISAYGGYASYPVEVVGKLSSGEKYTAVAYLMPLKEKNNAKALDADSFEISIR